MSLECVREELLEFNGEYEEITSNFDLCTYSGSPDLPRLLFLLRPCIHSILVRHDITTFILMSIFTICLHCAQD